MHGAFSKYTRFALRTVFIVAFSTAVASAQVTSTVPERTGSSGLSAWPSPSASPDPSPDRKSSTAWHNGRGPEYFIAGDYLFDTNSKNEFNPFGINDTNSFAGRAAVEYPIGKIAIMAEGTYDHFQYLHQAGDVTTIGGGQAFVPSFYAHNIDWDGRLGIGLQYPRIFAVASYAQRHNNFGYPNLQGYGFGIEKLPDFNEKMFSVFGSFLWYPQFGAGNSLQYGFYKYQAGIEYHVRDSHVPVFIEVGYLGDYGYNKRNAPTNISDSGLFAGLGFHL